MTIRFSQEDADLLFSPATIPEAGYVVFDERTGRLIRATYAAQTGEQCCPVGAEQVSRFIDGIDQMADFTVVYRGSEPLLVRGRPTELTVRQAADAFETVESAAPLINIRLILPLQTQQGQAVLETAPGMAVAFDPAEIEMIITQAGNPDDILAEVVLKSADLLDGAAVFDIDPLPADISIMMKPLTGVGVVVQRHARADQAIELPAGRFNDIQLYGEPNDLPGLLVGVGERIMRVSLREGGGSRYARTLPVLPITIARRDELEDHCGTYLIEVAKLEEGPVLVELTNPPPVEFDIVSPHLFSNAQQIDLRAAGAVVAPYRGQLEGLLVEIDRSLSAVFVRSLGGEAEDVSITFVHPDYDDIVYGSWTFDQASLAAGRGVQAVDLPDDYAIRTDSSQPLYWVDKRSVVSRFVPKRLRSEERQTGLAFWIDGSRNKLRAQLINGGGNHFLVERMTFELFIDDAKAAHYSLELSDLQSGRLLGFDLPELLPGKLNIRADSVYSSTYLVE